MTIPDEALHRLCPMHLRLDSDGVVRQAGPTLHKLAPEPLTGARFLDVFDVYRPRRVAGISHLLQTAGRKLHLRFRGGTRAAFKGHLVADATGGAVVDLSFGISVVEAVREFALTSTDFAPTDLAVEMLYLVEAKSAAMESSRRLNTRLQGAMIAAEEEAFTDTLTSLRNRRALDHVLERLARSGGSFALMQMDLDFFKQVNDTLGHAAGDHVLQVVARIMAEETRKDDTVARIGGDEFVIVISNAVTHSRLSELARRLITRIRRPIPYGGQDCIVSASIGISISENGSGTPAQIMEEADTALYAAKRAGRSAHLFHRAEPAADSLPPNGVEARQDATFPRRGT